jgi:hypothetical protein
MTLTTESDRPTAAQVDSVPEERFWKRYSPHHEFQLSGASSVALHAAVGALLVLGFILVQSLPGSDKKPLPIDAVVVADSAGGPAGAGASGPDFRDPKEDLPPDEPREAAKRQDDVPLKKAEPQPVPTPQQLPDQADQRLLSQSRAVLGQLDEIGRKARERIEASRRGSEIPGPGERGVGDGPQGNLLTKKRLQRWTLVFSTNDGEDYLKQLRSLGAILAVPLGENQFLVIRDLAKPEGGKVEDLAKIDRIFWVDDKPKSVGPLAKALKLKAEPAYVVAFFPKELEEELLDKELTHFRKTKPKGTEEEIEETHFRVEKKGDKYKPVVALQKHR